MILLSFIQTCTHGTRPATTAHTQAHTLHNGTQREITGNNEKRGPKRGFGVAGQWPICGVAGQQNTYKTNGIGVAGPYNVTKPMVFDNARDLAR